MAQNCWIFGARSLPQPLPKGKGFSKASPKPLPKGKGFSKAYPKPLPKGKGFSNFNMRVCATFCEEFNV